MSDITISNRALSLIGARASITALDSSSKEASACTLWYNDVRQALLRSAHWGFARKQADLTEVGNAEDETSLTPWQFMYSYPSDCLKVRYLIWPFPQGDNDLIPPSESLLPWTFPSRANRFIIGQASYGTPAATNRVILTNVEDAIGIYTADVTDTTLFDNLFEDAFVYALADALVIPLSGNVKMKADFRALATEAVNQARAMDGNEALPSTDHVPDWLLTRGVMTSAFGNGPNAGQWYAPWDSLPWGM